MKPARITTLPPPSKVEPGRPLMTITQVTAAAKVSRRTVYNWLAASRVACIRTAGGSIRVYADTVFRGAE